MLSHRYWCNVFETEFAPQLTALFETLQIRLLPQFEHIEDEAQKKSDQAWQEIMSVPSDGSGDPADFADAARDVGISYYSLMHGVRQGMVNFFAAALYHAFEQQLILFHRRQVLHPSEENDTRLFSTLVVRERLKSFGIDLDQLPAFEKVEELRLVANTVKHGDGNSAKKLYALRPDLFRDPMLNAEVADHVSCARVYQPIMGQDLYLSIDDLEKYLESLVAFWEELAIEMKIPF